jgi:hypothetical protein
MADMEINNSNVLRTEKIEFLVKEIIKLNLKIKDLEINKVNEDNASKVNITFTESNKNNQENDPKVSLILTELNKTNINYDSLPIVLF